MKIPDPEPDSDQINLIPLIDVFLVLLIFFLVATRMSEDEREISVRLAQVSKAQPLSMPPHEVVINVTDKGEFVVVGQRLDEPALAGFLHDLAMKNPSTQTVQIRADDRVPFRYPARVMGLCEAEKIGHYCTVTEEKDRSP
ncbi:MAG: biopolymer transporter ExbD [Thermoguttaceae bacterium]|jgi:biopolymer transport protein ExbD